MLKLGAKEKTIGTSIPCPTCRYPNLGINIWCERCRTPLEWTGQKLATVHRSAPASTPPTPAPAGDPPAPSPVVAPEPPDPPAVHPIASSARRARRTRAFAPPRLTVPAIAWPRLTMPRFAWPRLRMPTLTVPRLGLRRVPRIAWVVAAVLAILLIVPVAYVLLPSGRTVAARPSALAHLPSTSGATAGETPQAAAAIPGVEAKTSLHYSTGKCATNTACLTLASQAAGQDAGAVVFSTAGSDGRQCVGYVYQTGGRWHFLDAVCGLPGQLSPLVGRDATVHVPGNCANVRNGASLKAAVVACLKDGTTVHIDGGPTYADSRLWWHEKHGWIAHDFLTAP